PGRGFRGRAENAPRTPAGPHRRAQGRPRPSHHVRDDEAVPPGVRDEGPVGPAGAPGHQGTQGSRAVHTPDPGPRRGCLSGGRAGGPRLRPNPRASSCAHGVRGVSGGAVVGWGVTRILGITATLVLVL